MEEENVVKEKKGNVIVGIILSLIGGLIASVPWILMYVYGNMIYSALAIIIALGAFYGYKLSKAKIDKKVPVVIAVVSIICVTISTLVIIPMLLLAKEGHQISMENIQYLYDYDEFRTAIIGDYVISLLFTILGISGIIMNLHKQIKKGVDEKEISALENNAENEKEEDTVNSGKEVKKKKSSATKNVIIILVLAVILIGISMAFNSDNTSKIENIKNVEISNTDMKINLTNELELLTDEEIDDIYGIGASQYYEFVAMNFTGTKNIICFVDNKSGLGEYTTKEKYLQLIFEDAGDVEVKEKNISGYDFSVVYYDYTYEGKDYTEECLIYEQENEFICLDVVYPRGEAIDLEKIISKK